MKTYLFANFQFDRVFRLVTKQGRISKLLCEAILKWRPRMLSCRLKKVTYSLRFHNLNSPYTRISSHIDVYEPSEDEDRLFIENSMTCVFASFRPLYLRPSEAHKHDVSIQ